MKPSTLACLALALLASAAWAQSINPAPALESLHSDSTEVRKQFSRDVYGAGIDDSSVYDGIAHVLSSELDTVAKHDPRLDEMAWHLKALSGSGDLAYMPLIERAKASDVRFLARYADDAKDTLVKANRAGRPYLTTSHVVIISENQANACRYIAQMTCDANGDTEECMDYHREQAIRAGGDSIQLLMSSTTNGILPVFGKKTLMVANYYNCRHAIAANSANASP